MGIIKRLLWGRDGRHTPRVLNPTLTPPVNAKTRGAKRTLGGKHRGKGKGKHAG